MNEFLEACVTGPMLVATILATTVLLYWLAALGGLSLEVLDLDFDLDWDAEAEPPVMLSLGSITLRSLNLGRVPLMIWLTVFAGVFFAVSWFLRPEEAVSYAMSSALVCRNMALSLLPTKLITQPLRGMFDIVAPNPASEIIGRTATATIETGRDYGQVRVEIEKSSPLLLNAHTPQGIVAKGTRVLIVEYDAEKHIYLVEPESDKPV